MIQAIKPVFFLFLGLGALLIVADEAWKRKNRKRFDYLDVKIWTEGDYISGSLRGKEKEKAKELIENLAENGRVVWFGAPQLSGCLLEMWDAWKERFYRVCRGKDGKWYVQLPGSSGGRSTERYLEIEEKEALEMMEKLRKLL